MDDSKRIKVALVDDHQIMLDGLVALLGNDPDFHIIAALSSGEAFLQSLQNTSPHILLTDYNLPGISGLDLTRQIKKKHPGIKVVMLSMHDEVQVVKSILKEGVDGYLLKNIPQFELKNALKRIMQDVPYVSPEITRLMLDEMNNPQQTPQPLTERELEILKLITEEFANKEIAAKLFISERTVETHRKNIFRKTNSNSLVGLIRYAFENKLF